MEATIAIQERVTRNTRGRPRVGARTLAHAIVSAAVILGLLAAVASSRSATRVLWSLPYILSDVSLLIFLTLSLARRPIDMDARPSVFLAAVAGSVSPFVVAITGSWLPWATKNMLLGDVGATLSVLLTPSCLVGLWTLGRRLTVLPEANELQTRGIYSISRHPLYATYICCFAVQNLVYQSWWIVALSLFQAWLMWFRASREENVLLRTFPDYAAYKREVLWFGRREWISPALLGKALPD